MKSDDVRECLCSSLAINCFQLGCCLHGSPRCHCAHANDDWMTKLMAVSPEKKIRDLVIPGTHDSASVTISNWAPFSAVGLCQNVSVNEQLRRGARYLDLRVGGTTDSTLVDDTFICHGMLKGGLFPDVIEEVHQFLCDYPREFIVLEVIYDPNKHEMSSEQRLRVLQLLSSTFDEMVTQEDVNSWFNLKNLTLGELEKKKKNIIVLIDDRICNFSHEGTQYDLATVAREFGCHKNGNFLKNKWHNTANAQTLLRSNETFLEGACNDCDFFMNSQFVMTPQPPGGVSDVLGLLFGAKSLRPVSLARELYRKDVLETFIRDNADNRWNIVLLDFLDLCPQLIKYVTLRSAFHFFVFSHRSNSKTIPYMQCLIPISGFLLD